MKTCKYLTLFFVLLFCFSCDEKPAEKTPKTQPKKVNLKPVNQLVDFLYPSNGSYIHFGDSLPIRFSIVNQALDSIIVKTDLERLQFENDLEKLDKVMLNFNSVGAKSISITFFQKGEHQTVTKEIRVLSDETPKKISYKVVQKYPHDKDAYTQGLEFVGDDLYESTGLKGYSSFRKVTLESGLVSKQENVSREFFAEGLTFFNDKFYQLTWQKNVCFVYDKQMNLLQTKTLPFQSEGWGLTHNDSCLIMSNGTENIYFLDSETLLPLKTLAVYNNEGPVKQLNELELVEGMILANIYQSNDVVVIDPTSGKVKGVLDMTGLLQNKDIIKGYTDVLNGIAYHSPNKKLYLTGKRWPFLYQIDVPFLHK